MARSVSDEYRSLLNVSREVVARVEILDADRTPIISTDPSSSHPLKVTALSVSVDSTRTIWGNAHCTIAVPAGSAGIVPASATGLLSPISGATFRVWAGYRLPSTGQPELVPCGRYDIERCVITEDASGVRVELEGEDLTSRLDVADLTAPESFVMGANKLLAVEYLVSTVIPDLQFLTVPSGQTTGWVMLDEQANRLTECISIMTSMGYVMFMDADGLSLHMEPRATTGDTPAWVYDESSIRVVPHMQNSLDRARVYNGVIAKGENTLSDVPPVRAEAWDTDPTSPTHYIPSNPVRTRIGPRPYFMTSQYIVTQEQAQNAANAQLLRLRGLLQQVSLQVATNPAIEVGDVIHIDRPGVGVVGSYVVQSVGFDLATPETMDLVCEERRVALP